MKALITSFNQKLGVNPIVGRMLDAIPGVVRASVEECEVIFLLFIAPECDFVLDRVMLDAASRRKLPVIIFDATETFPQQFVFSVDSLPQESGYKILEAWIRSNTDVKAYFKRELLSAHSLPATAFPIFALDWTLSVL